MSFNELINHLGCTGPINNVLFHPVIKKLAGVADVNGCLDLISCQYPDLDASLLELSNRDCNIFLEFILDSRGSKEIESVFELVGDSIYLFLSVDD